MNEIKKCSISGVAFTLDKEAYQELEQYIESLRNAYKHTPEGAEIIADIEARIAELILSAQDGGQVVETPLIRNIIRQLGTAEDISDKEAHSDADLQTETPRIPRRLYRDMDNAKLGGVCSGIGKYFDLDPVWVRLGFFVPLIFQLPFPFYWMHRISSNLFGVFVLSYIIMWFVVPVARSARQKLEMNGSPITAQSLAAASSAPTDADSKAKTAIADAVSVFGKVVVIIMKVIAGMLVLSLILAACALVIGLLCVAVGGYEFIHAEPGEFSIWLPITGILIALILVLLLIYVLMCLIASRKPNGKTILATFLLWIATIVACILLAVNAKSGRDARDILRFSNSYSRTPVERPALEELEEQLEQLEGLSIEIRDSTNNVQVVVRRNRTAPAADAAGQPEEE